jgi:hypothetical protein
VDLAADDAADSLLRFAPGVDTVMANPLHAL